MSAFRTTTTCTGCGNEIPESLLDDALCTRCRYTSTKKDVEHLDGDGSPLPTEYEIAADKFAFDTFADASDGQRGPIVEAEIATDEAPRIDAEQLLDALITGAKNTKEVGQRAVILAFLLKRPAAPQSKTALAALLGVSRPTGDKLLTVISQCLQRELHDCFTTPRIGRWTTKI